MSATTEVRERPILFSGPMLRALIEGRKTQTRRLLTNRNTDAAWRVEEYLLDDPRTFVDAGFSPAPHRQQYLHAPLNCAAIEKRMGWERGDCSSDVIERVRCRYEVGDRLWVREAVNVLDGVEAVYAADNAKVPGGENLRSARGVIPSIHMPRWASRLTLEITEVRVERVRDISEEDVAAEGFPLLGGVNDSHGNRITGPRNQFVSTWQRINGAGSWQSNPWVWALTFKVIGGAP